MKTQIKRVYPRTFDSKRYWRIETGDASFTASEGMIRDLIVRLTAEEIAGKVTAADSRLLIGLHINSEAVAYKKAGDTYVTRDGEELQYDREGWKIVDLEKFFDTDGEANYSLKAKAENSASASLNKRRLEILNMSAELVDLAD